MDLVTLPTAHSKSVCNKLPTWWYWQVSIKSYCGGSLAFLLHQSMVSFGGINEANLTFGPGRAILSYYAIGYAMGISERGSLRACRPGAIIWWPNPLQSSLASYATTFDPDTHRECSFCAFSQDSGLEHWFSSDSKAFRSITATSESFQLGSNSWMLIFRPPRVHHS